MRTSNTILILLFFALLSCKKKTNPQFEKDIVGEWTLVRIQDNRQAKIDNELILPSPPHYMETSDYIFFEDKECTYKFGYFKVINREEIENSKIIYLGNKTQYKIEDDSLKILKLSDSTWQSQKIYSIVGDTLTIQINDSFLFKYARTKYNLNPNETYDQIVVSSSGCYGTCPIMDISIHKSGEILFFAGWYNTVSGFFSAKITAEEFQNIILTFKKANIVKLKEDYDGGWTDDERVTITFIKDNKIVKTISDYGHVAPKELIWAYTPVRYLYQQIKLTPVKRDKLNLPRSGANFENGDNICNLSKSESFYLFTEIQKGKEVKSTLEIKYKIRYWNEQNKTSIIFTDGRLYKLENKIIDIGYNFLTENNLNKRFRIKYEYER